MDKAEYQNRLDELKAGIDAGDYEKAREIADGIDWRRVKSVRTLCMVADVYEKTRSYPKAKEILQIAQARSSIGRGVLSRLVEICLKLGQTDEAEAYFRDYSKVAQGDNSRLVLQYQIYRAKGAPLDAQITVLEEYREKEYTEEWAYELAERYAEAGDQEKCVETCDDLILWFSEGKYVLKALELKKQFEPLTEKQMALYIQERDAENERARQAALAKARAEAEKKASAEAAERERQQAALREQEALAAEEESGNEAEDETVPAVTEDEAGAAAPDAVSYPAETESVPDQAEPEYGSDLLRQDGGVYPAAPENEEEGRLNGNLSSKTGGDALDGLDIPGFVNVIPLKQENRETEPEVPADQAEPVYAGEGYDDEPEEIREKAPAEEGLKGRLLKSFHNMFGDDRRRRNAEDESEDEEFPKKDERKKKDIHLFRKKDPREADQFEPAVKEPAVEEPEERNLRLRDLAPEAAMLGGAAASVAAGATGELPVEDVRPLSEKKQQVAFDLDSFLNETA
ncbi:MAG: hypothetical protein HUJ73_01460, partial [Eubacterium sp.]|nr:hypothetical protein [Eubacterium sp.]